MSISAINNVGTAVPTPIKNKNIAFGCCSEEGCSCSKNTASTIAAVAGVGSLVLSTIFLLKANKIQKEADLFAKQAQLVVEFANKQIESAAGLRKAFSEFGESTGLTKVGDFVSKLLTETVQESGSTFKKLGELAKKANSGIEGDELAKVNKEFDEEIGNLMQKVSKKIGLDPAKATEEGAEAVTEAAKTDASKINVFEESPIFQAIKETPLGQILKAIFSGKITPSSEKIAGLSLSKLV